jgi:hypothetical protein
MAQGAGRFADAGAKYVAAALAEGLHAGHTGDLFGGAVEGSNSPFPVHREDAIGDGVQDRVARRVFLVLYHGFVTPKSN